MNEFRTDEEQAEIIKKWWADNGSSIVLSLVLVLGGWFGWNTYQDSVASTGEAASSIYSQLADKMALPAEQQTAAVKDEMLALAQQLQSEYDSTVYSQFAGLFLARFAADADDFATAETELRAVIAAADEGPLKLTAQVRLANVLVELDKADDALALIPAQLDASYAAQFEEVRGDALYRKGDFSAAREAYAKAKQAALDLGANSDVLQRKIDSLAALSGDAEAETEEQAEAIAEES